MKYSYPSFPPYSERNFSISDSYIGRIDIENDCVRFCFPNGFFCVDHGKIRKTNSSYIEIDDCDADEFNCYYFNREKSENGAILYGQPISLSELGLMLIKTGSKLEVYLELYDFDFLHWRCILVPYQPDGLSSRIDIEISGHYPFAYYWE